MSKPEIVPAELEDLNLLLDIENRCFTNPWSPRHFSSAIASPFLDIYKCRQNNRISGYIALYRTRSVVVIANLAVAPEFRKTGLGNALLDYGLEDSREKGCKFCLLDVRQSNNRAVSLYKKAGFLIIGSNKDYYQNPREDSWVIGRSV